MTPWLRTLRTTGLVGAALGVGAVVSPYGTAPARATAETLATAPARPITTVVAKPAAALAGPPAPSPGSSSPERGSEPGVDAGPDGSATHDGRGGHERP
ncbi:hypothetical protein GTW46_20035, partial [Streptomyces sp. SID6013]|nr:hypothetical protein [Streptomyces sp. SID6013]